VRLTDEISGGSARERLPPLPISSSIRILVGGGTNPATTSINGCVNLPTAMARVPAKVERRIPPPDRGGVSDITGGLEVASNHGVGIGPLIQRIALEYGVNTGTVASVAGEPGREHDRCL